MCLNPFYYDFSNLKHRTCLLLSTWVQFAKQWQALLCIYSQKSLLCYSSIITIIPGWRSKVRYLWPKQWKLLITFNEAPVLCYFHVLCLRKSMRKQLTFLTCCSGGRSPAEGSGSSRQPWEASASLGRCWAGEAGPEGRAHLFNHIHRAP